MPKIPTFTSKGTITSQGPSVTTNLQIPLTQTVGAALQPISKYVEQEYIKEKKLEENNKVDKLISNSYKDNPNGPVGFLTLSSETGKSANPTDASNIYDQGVDKLYNFISLLLILFVDFNLFNSLILIFSLESKKLLYCLFSVLKSIGNKLFELIALSYS